MKERERVLRRQRRAEARAANVRAREMLRAKPIAVAVARVIRPARLPPVAVEQSWLRRLKPWVTERWMSFRRKAA